MLHALRAAKSGLKQFPPEKQIIIADIAECSSVFSVAESTPLQPGWRGEADLSQQG
jgi:hypothetical protein